MPKIFMIKEILYDNKKTTQEKIMTISEILGNQATKNSAGLNEEKKTFLFIEDFESEVNNGGFSQFFFNSSGDFSHETLGALKTIHADEVASLLEKAIAEFPNAKVPKDRNEREEIMEKIEDKAETAWENLDTIFYTYPDDIAALLLKFIKDNIQGFFVNSLLA
jgi:hypothetical protein